MTKRHFLLAILSAGLAAPVAGAERSGFYLTSPFSVDATRETRFIVDDVALDDNVVIVLLPTLSLVHVKPRGQVALSYQPEFEGFQEHSELNAVNHSAELVLAHHFDPRTTVAAGDSFISTSDPSRRVVDSILLLPRNHLTENSAYLELAHRFGRATTFSVRGDNTITRVGAPLASATELQDQLAASGTVSLSQAFGRHHSFSISYSHLFARPLGETAERVLPSGLVLPAPTTQNANSAVLGWVYENRGLALRFSGGAVRGQDTTYTGSAEVETALGRAATFSLLAQRNLSFFGGIVAQEGLRLANGLLPTSVYESIRARLTGDLSRHVTLTGDLSAQRSVSDLTGFDVHSYLGRARLGYHVSRTLAVHGTVELYRQSFNEFVGSQLDWQRYGIGFDISPSHKPNPLAAKDKAQMRRERRMKAAAEEDVLPAGQGQSTEPGASEAGDIIEKEPHDADPVTRH